MISIAEQEKMFGLTTEQMELEKPEYIDNLMWAMSILSDVQHVMNHNQEQARQWVNKAKFWISEERRNQRETAA